MNVYAISDLHLSTVSPKPMDIFGGNWEGHFEKIKADWQEKVKDDDVVLIAGDISWAMKLDDARADLNALSALKGKKVFIRGNHDFWWNGISKVRAAAPNDSFVFLQTGAIKIGEFVFVGSRGWTCPGSADYTEQDQKLYLREAERFSLAFQEAEKLKTDGDKLVALIHYPPFNAKGEDSLFTKLFEEKGVDKAVFGHIHGLPYFPLKTVRGGVEYILTSCDKVAFKLVKIY
ncbi:MAG: serine/threonine protein phosphatase [Clostridiales bacterium]|nr:serine/threonine protein phosphatase [Clostridiales bacterium]